MGCIYFRDKKQNKGVKKIKIDKKPPHAISNRALNSVVNTLNKTSEINTESQDTEEHGDSERYNIFRIEI